MARHRPRHAAPAPRSAWRPLALATVATVALASSAGGVYALLRATATATQAATTGTLLLTSTANGTFGTTITGLAPGDTAHRFVRLTNTGTLAGTGLTASVSSAAPNDLSNGSTTALQVTITECSSAWTVTGPAGTCSGTTTGTSVNNSRIPVAAAALAPGTLAATNGQRHLRISFTVPDLGEVSTDGALPSTTVQGKSTSLTLTFTEDQRPATPSSS